MTAETLAGHQGGALPWRGPRPWTSERSSSPITCVDKIIKGAQPGEIPIELNPRIEFVLNRNVARQRVLNVPAVVP